MKLGVLVVSLAVSFPRWTEASVDGIADTIPLAHPDIFVFIVDDATASDRAFMPLTNQLVGDEGVVFENGVSHTTLCDPSRATLFTGLFRSHHGVIGDAGSRSEVLFDWTKAFSFWLHDAGYYTALVAKDFANSPFRAPVPGWDVFDNQVKIRYTAAHALAAVRVAPRDRPRLFYIGYHYPHYPATVYATEDTSLFGDLEPWRPGSYNETDVSDKPKWVRELPLLSQTQSDSLDVFRRRRLQSLQSVDRSIRDILVEEAMEGRLENAVIFFVSDQGIGLGEHRQFRSKDCIYEECVRVPFLVRAPDEAIHVDPSSLVSLVDIAPTIADYAEIDPPAGLDGRSFRGLLRDPATLWPNATIHQAGQGKMKAEAIRTERYVYSEYPKTRERELYDLMLDPWELQNVVNDSAYAGTRDSLSRLLHP